MLFSYLFISFSLSDVFHLTEELLSVLHFHASFLVLSVPGIGLKWWAEGFEGSISAMLEPPYSKGSCKPVACPEHSTGPNVGKGCRCDLGYHGEISAIREAPELSFSVF